MDLELYFKNESEEFTKPSQPLMISVYQRINIFVPFLKKKIKNETTYLQSGGRGSSLIMMTV